MSKYLTSDICISYIYIHMIYNLYIIQTLWHHIYDIYDQSYTINIHMSICKHFDIICLVNMQTVLTILTVNFTILHTVKSNGENGDSNHTTHTLICYITFHKLCMPSEACWTAELCACPLKVFLSLNTAAGGLFKASHDFTYFKGCQLWKGGPLNEMNIKHDMWGTVNIDRKLLHMIFILLKPRSQAAVLTGIVQHCSAASQD